MKSPTVLHCEQCESETGTLISSELDITYCTKIENARGRLVCTNRETRPPPTQTNDDETNKEDTKQPDVPKPEDKTEDPDLKEPEDAKDPDDVKDLNDLEDENKDPDDPKDKEDGKDKDEEDERNDDNPLVNPPIDDDTPLPDPNTEKAGDYTDEFEHPTDGLPAGSYRKLCTGCELLRQGKLLACDFCTRNNGYKRYTVALVDDCKFFVCIDGTLRCDKVHSAQL